MNLALRLGVTGWLGVLVALPVAVLIARGLERPAVLLETLSDPVAQEALWLSLWTAGVAAAVSAVTGTAVAWALVRWDVPGRRLLSALVDLPLAIHLRIRPGSFESIRTLLAGLPISDLESTGDSLACRCPRAMKMAVLAALAPRRDEVLDLDVREPSLEDVFFGVAD